VFFYRQDTRVLTFEIVWLLVFPTVASAGMVWKPDTKTAVLVGIFVHRCCCKGSQAYRGLIQHHYGDSPETLASGLRIFNFSDVLGYSFASLVGGVLYELGAFQACAWFQLIATLTQALLTYAVCRGTGVTAPRPPLYTENADTPPESAAPVTPQEVTTPRCSVVPVSFAIVSVGMSAFLYTCEWNTFALYFREVYGWGSAWTGFAQMIGDLFAGMCLVLVSLFKLRAPPIFENKVCFLLSLSQPPLPSLPLSLSLSRSLYLSLALLLSRSLSLSRARALSLSLSLSLCVCIHSLTF
jgi:hypothetical protein